MSDPLTIWGQVPVNNEEYGRQFYNLDAAPGIALHYFPVENWEQPATKPPPFPAIVTADRKQSFVPVGYLTQDCQIRDSNNDSRFIDPDPANPDSRYHSKWPRRRGDLVLLESTHKARSEELMQ